LRDNWYSLRDIARFSLSRNIAQHWTTGSGAGSIP
jgi:hypothetical protein